MAVGFQKLKGKSTRHWPGAEGAPGPSANFCKCRLSYPESADSTSESLSRILEGPAQWYTEEGRSKTLGGCIRNTAEGGPPLWEALPGQSPQRTLAEEVGVILVKRVVTPEVSPQAVDQPPVTSTEPHWTE